MERCCNLARFSVRVCDSAAAPTVNRTVELWQVDPRWWISGRAVLMVHNSSNSSLGRPSWLHQTTGLLVSNVIIQCFFARGFGALRVTSCTRQGLSAKRVLRTPDTVGACIVCGCYMSDSLFMDSLEEKHFDREIQLTLQGITAYKVCGCPIRSQWAETAV